MTHILKGNHFPADLILGELLPWDMLVLRVIRTVGAAVDAVVGQVQWREHDDTVSVEILLDLLGKFVDLLVLLLDGTGEQNGGLPVGQTFPFFGFLDDGVDQFHIFFVLICIGESLKDLLMIDKIICTF